MCWLEVRAERLIIANAIIERRNTSGGKQTQSFMSARKQTPSFVSTGEQTRSVVRSPSAAALVPGGTASGQFTGRGSAGP